LSRQRRGRRNHERKRAEAALKASERQFHTLADSIPQLVWMAEAGGKIFWFNNHWREYAGTDSQDWQTALAPGPFHKARDLWARALQTGTPFELELSLRGKDGQYRPFLTRAVPLRDSTAAVYGWIGTHIDISERKRNEQELRSARDAAETALSNLRETQNSLIEAEKLAALGRLVAGVAHEINNPVGTSLTVASSLERKTTLIVDELARGTLKRSTLNDFLEISREASSQLVANLNRAANLIQSFKQVCNRSELFKSARLRSRRADRTDHHEFASWPGKAKSHPHRRMRTRSADEQLSWPVWASANQPVPQFRHACVPRRPGRHR